jgi:hypothetical protein
MNVNDRLLAVWTRFIGFLLAPLAMLSVVLEWSSVVQLALTLLMGSAVFGTQLVLTRARRRH